MNWFIPIGFLGIVWIAWMYRQLGRLLNRTRHSMSETSRIVYVTGPPGVGKTTMIDTWTNSDPERRKSTIVIVQEEFRLPTNKENLCRFAATEFDMKSLNRKIECALKTDATYIIVEGVMMDPNAMQYPGRWVVCTYDQIPEKVQSMPGLVDEWRNAVEKIDTAAGECSFHILMWDGTHRMENSKIQEAFNNICQFHTTSYFDLVCDD